MLMTIEKPKDKGKVDADMTMLDLVDRSDEVVVGMIYRVVKALILYRVPQEQRDGATIREEQQTLADIALGELVNAACVASVRSTGKVMEQRKQSSLGVELAKCGFSKDCEGCRVAASGDEVSRPHGKECRERTRAAVMCDDAGQQRLRLAEKRLAPAASAARADVAQEGQASPARVELAQESRDEEMSEACVTDNAENVKPRVEILREESTEAISRMEDGNTPVGGPLASAEVNSRSEVFYRRESEDQRKEALRTQCWSMQTRRKCASARWQVILKSLDVASASERVAEPVSVGFGDSAVGMASSAAS